MYTVCVGRAVDLHALNNFSKLCNILSANLQRKHSFRRENWLDQMRGLRKEIFFFSCVHWTKECEALGGFRSRGQVLRVSVRAQRPDIPGGTNACGYYDQQRKEKWPGSTNRCQPSILPALELSEVNKVCLCVWVLELGRLAPGSIWSWTSLQLAATQMDRQFCRTWYMNSVESLGLSLLSAPTLRELLTTKKI